MNDMRGVIVPKSDQINADDMLAGPMTITIREVSIRPGTEQPVSISFDGDQGKPWKPCKSMCRVLVLAWGPDAKVYVGRSATLYCDPKVKWGGMDVGGIRVSHLSHIDREMIMVLTATKGKKAPFTIKPLTKPVSSSSQSPSVSIAEIASEAARRGTDAFRTFWKTLKQSDRAILQPTLASYQSIAKEADDAIPDDPFAEATTISEIADPSEFVIDLSNALQAATSRDALAAIEESNREHIARLDNDQKLAIAATIDEVGKRIDLANMGKKTGKLV